MYVLHTVCTHSHEDVSTHHLLGYVWCPWPPCPGNVTAALKYQNFISKLTLIVSALLKSVSIHRIYSTSLLTVYPSSKIINRVFYSYGFISYLYELLVCLNYMTHKGKWHNFLSRNWSQLKTSFWTPRRRICGLIVFHMKKFGILSFQD